MAIQIGKYKRPGIFNVEYDNSVLSSPTVEGLSTMVIGFSKKGPVNTPVLLTNSGDVDKIFGSIDRNLERKGSFFHRTIGKLIESSPVYAINLLLTDDNLDIIDYKSLSTSAIFKNDVTRSGAYRKFFDTTGFWKRDTDAFINLVNLDANQVGDDNRVLNLTNLSDKFATVFIFKSKITGYDRSLLEWYGSIDKLPSYLNQADWASDFMVDVMIIGGEWSDYATLSTDAKWSRYFNPSGLKTDQIYNFANDSLVNNLGFYEGLSLIPYFRNSNDTNVFIETVLNRDTDKTGIFCAFNSDLFETDVQNNKIDLIGNSIVGSGATAFNFLSYNEIIVEDIVYENTLLDRVGNVFSIGASTLTEPTLTNRTGFYSEGHVNNLTSDYIGTTASITVEYSVKQDTFAIIDENIIDNIDPASFTFTGGTASFPESVGVTASYKYVYKLDATGLISQVGGIGLSSLPQVGASDIVLSTLEFEVIDGAIILTGNTFRDICIDTTGFSSLLIGVDYTITNVGTADLAELKIEFLNTSGTITSANYTKFRKLKTFNYLLSALNSNNSNKAALLLNTAFDKVSFASMSVKDITTNTINNKSLTIVTNMAASQLGYILSGNLTIYKLDNEIVLGTSGMSESNSVATLTNGITSTWSDFNLNFKQGVINSGDYFKDGTNEVYLEMYDTVSGTVTKFKTVEGAIYTLSESSDLIVVTSNKSNFKQTVDIEVRNNYSQISNKILINAARYTEVKVGDFLESDWEATWLTSNDYDADREPRRMVRILSKRLFSEDNTLVELITDGGIKKSNSNGELQTTRFTKLEDYVNAYNGITLRGFRVRSESMPDGTESRQNALLNLVSNGTPLYKAITNKEAIDFRYLVDGFGLGLTEFSKQQLMDICGKRLDVFGFLNMPSLKSFKNSSSPSYINAEGVLQMEYVAKGGNPESSPSFLYSFGEGEGVSAAGYFLPYLTVNDNGRPLDVPPAMFVASTYLRKSNSNVSTITPYTVAAGITNGKITGITGVEELFSNEDIEFLNLAQMNPIVYKRNRGYVIETENTALTLYRSSLSFIHSREVLIELEREISAMLLDFQWKTNTPEVRAEIKLRADVICGTFVSKNGLYTYFNKCDDENNTSELIDNQMGVLSTFVEITKNLAVIVNEVTILRTGAIQSSGFRAQ